MRFWKKNMTVMRVNDQVPEVRDPEHGWIPLFQPIRRIMIGKGTKRGIEVRDFFIVDQALAPDQQQDKINQPALPNQDAKWKCINPLDDPLGQSSGLAFF